jgi:hypothetical protein
MKMDLKNIQNQYRPIPFWSWNEKLDEKETRSQIEKMDDAGIGGFFMHARGGLQTEYMSDEWFANVAASIDEAKKRGMRAWAYDENGWPSGFGSGIVNGKGVAYQQKYLRFEKGERQTERTITNQGGYHFYYDVNPFYVDTLDGKVTDCFIREIYLPYYEKFGTSFEGFFTDEPQISRNGIPWSFILPEEYARAYGEDLLPLLPQLFMPIGNYKQTRVNFWKLVTELFSRNFMKRIYDFCDERGLKLTGHVVLEENLLCQLVTNGACMPHYEYFHIPGMDWLGRHNKPSLTPYQVGSVARQLGKKQVLSETFACCGHGVGHDELKWIYEYQMVRGINLLCQHLQGYSNRGLRKRDYPPAMYIQQPWWEDYGMFNDAMSRIGMLLSEGDDGVETLVLHPQTTAWALYDDAPQKDAESLRAIGYYHKSLMSLIGTLERKHINFHLGDEILMERHARVEGASLVIGEKAYTKIILPEHELFLGNTEKLLAEYQQNGGVILQAADVEGLPENCVIDIQEITYCERRMEDMDVYFFVNSTAQTYHANISVGTHIMDPVTGDLYPFDGTHEFKKYASLVVIDNRAGRREIAETKAKTPLPLDGAWRIDTVTENCMTLDYCDYDFDGEPQGNAYILDVMYHALERERDIHIRMSYTVELSYLPRSLFLVCETPEIFTIRVNGKTADRADKGYFRDKAFRKLDITELLLLGKNEIELETDFRQSPSVYENMAKSKIFESEKNKLTFDTELEQIYLVGDFSVETEGAFTELERNASRFTGMFSIGEPKKEVTLDRMERQGFPFFAGTLKVSRSFIAEHTDYALDLVKCGWNVIKAEINGRALPPMMWEPFTQDLSEYLRVGENEISLTLTNNLRNMQGPLHLEIGESHSLGPSEFYRRKCVWGGGAERWNDGYCFLTHSVRTREDEVV